MARPKIPKDLARLPKSRPKGDVNFHPFERLDEASLRQVRKFRIHPFGNIQDYSRHIPYNSGKKDFYEKTGRESFEVFHYEFKVPGDDTEYTVMWDYNVGLVRMTPFFKCCKYPKTTPAKMLNLNPGLKDITHSITGGAIMAQGYWMPYQCAKAVCATFCHNIAGALIPIFGPDFPSLCTHSDAPEYSRMIIDRAIVVQATREAENFRRFYSNPVTSSPFAGGSSSPTTIDRRAVRRSPYDGHPKSLPPHPQSHTHHHHHHSHTRHTHRHPSTRKTFFQGTNRDSPYKTMGDVDGGDLSPVVPPQRSNMGTRTERFNPYSPIPPPPPPSSASSLRPAITGGGWTPANVVLPPPPRHHYHQQHHHHHSSYDPPAPSPWLSAVPRFTTTAHLPLYQPSQPQPTTPHHQQPQSQPQLCIGGKRSADHVEADNERGEDCDGTGARRRPAEREGPEANRRAWTAMATRKSNTEAEETTAASDASRQRRGGGGESRSDSSKQPPPRPILGGADKNAALLLMNLSVGDAPAPAPATRGEARTAHGGGPGAGGGVAAASETNPACHDGACPRIKRIRSNSM
ncbi:hypothetical protein GGS23DRAFT_615213 [Durotheca rogersii]|uniref:uncharacterized protein n=1 Tax=Durotheca rogersii TaxID=419775 RepID=UPI00221F4F2B|nr:uncharacterized protein GGS23DRAFT_615213 [Durotheca rogersii]KAI5866664.1 hypothetical protein GGS23DRAFT_615213 [Durotheca rogersii]